MRDRPMEMPKVGDRLIVEHSEYGGSKRIKVDVTATFRYRFTVRAHALGTYLPDYFRNWDVRTGTAWGYTGNYRPVIGTEQWWCDADRRATAWTMVSRRFGINSWDLRGDLKAAAQADPVRFAAVLEQFIISVNEESK